MSPPQDRHSHCSTLRVRYAETDTMGVAHHANYIIWFELARMEFLREQGISYREMESQGIFLPVSEVGTRMKSSAYFDDELKVYCWIGELRSRSLRFEYEIARPEEGAGEVAIATGFVTLVCTGPDRRSRSFAPALRQLLAKLGPNS